MQENLANSNRETWADVLRAVGIIGVILLHVSAVIVYRFDLISSVDWLIANIINSFSRFCVPIFLMLTGFFLLPVYEPYNKHLKKLLNRIILPFFFWSCIYVFFLIVADLNVIFSLKSILKKGISYHFWYVYLIVGIYLVMPLLRKILDVLPNYAINLMLLVWPLTFLFQLEEIKKLIPYSSAIYYVGYLGYVLLGYRISKMQVTKFPQWLSWLLFITGSLATAGITYWLTTQSNKFNSIYYQYLSPTVLVSVIGIFLAIKNCTKIHPVVKLISKSSYGLYLSHVLLLNFMLSAHVQELPIWIYFPVTFNACLLASLALVNLLQKLPFGKYFSGIST